MQVSKLRIIAAASEHVDFILVDGQPETVSCVGQVAVNPLLPLTGLETVGTHALSGERSTAVGLF